MHLACGHGELEREGGHPKPYMGRATNPRRLGPRAFARLYNVSPKQPLSLIPQAVGKDRFREDARKVMGVLQQLQAPGLLEADDPTLGYMMQVWA